MYHQPLRRTRIAIMASLMNRVCPFPNPVIHLDGRPHEEYLAHPLGPDKWYPPAEITVHKTTAVGATHGR